MHKKFVYSLTSKSFKKSKGFTLVELAIVLVIVGLLVAGVIQGKELIETAQLNSQLAQLKSYETSINTFKLKFRQLPGDITGNIATVYGFEKGNGDGVVTSLSGGCCYWGSNQRHGEAVSVWVDLSKANLIKENFSTASKTIPSPNLTVPIEDVPLYLPKGTLGANYGICGVVA